MSIKLFFASSLIVLMVSFMILAFSLYTGVIRISISDAEAYHKDSLNKIANALEIQLDNLSRFAGSLCYDKNYNSTNQGPEDLWEYRNILGDLQAYSALNELDARFTLFLGSKEKGLSSHENIVKMSPELMNPLYKRNRRWMIANSDEGDLVSYFIVHDGEFSDRQVSVLIQIDHEPLHRQLEALNIRNKGLAFLEDSEGRMIFSRATPYRELLMGLDMDIDRDGLLLLRKQQLRVMHTPLAGSLSLGIAFPEDSIMMPVRKTNAVLIGIFLVAMVLFTTIFVLLYKWITHPLHNLYHGMASVEKGNFAVLLKGHHINEIDFILNKFNRMAGRIRLLLDEVRLESLRSQEAEFRFLQAQINPHFLYNNLFFIYQMCQSGENEKAGDMAITLSKYFKNVTRPRSSLVPLKVELENLHDYISLFSMRHPDRFSYEEEIDDELMNQLVPRLLLQPVVENSFVYGMDNSAEPITVKIDARQMNGRVLITVSDTGAGLDTDKMNELNRKLSTSPDQLEGCGLRNPLQRLQFRFGDNSTIRLEPNKPSGVIVLLEFAGEIRNKEEAPI